MPSEDDKSFAALATRSETEFFPQGGIRLKQRLKQRYGSELSTGVGERGFTISALEKVLIRDDNELMAQPSDEPKRNGQPPPPLYHPLRTTAETPG